MELIYSRSTDGFFKIYERMIIYNKGHLNGVLWRTIVFVIDKPFAQASFVNQRNETC